MVSESDALNVWVSERVRVTDKLSVSVAVSIFEIDAVPDQDSVVSLETERVYNGEELSVGLTVPLVLENVPALCDSLNVILIGTLLDKLTEEVNDTS